jgi:hypothetical protein
VPNFHGSDGERGAAVKADGTYARAGVRVNSKVKIVLERKGGGTSTPVQGYTMDISSHGCMAVMPEPFELGETLTLTNLINQQKCEVTPMWRGQKDDGEWELGLRLKEPPQDFWELDF